MYRDHKVAVVVPCYNEETQIGPKVIETMPDFIDHIVIIDDVSKDKTVEVVKEYQQKNPKVVLIEHPKNQGVGGAIASGYEWARDNDCDIAVVMAGDGQMDPIDLPRIMDPVVEDECDYSKANRLHSGEAYKKIPRIRYLGNSMLSLLTKIASGYWHIADSQTGYTAINKKALKAIDWQTMYKRYGQPNDLLVKLNVYRFRVKDVITEPVYNVGEQSKLNIKKAVFTIGWLLVKLFFWRMKEKYIIRDFHPLVLFYGMGFIFFIATLGFGGRLIYMWTQLGYAPELTTLAFLFSFGFGLQSIFFAFWFDMESNRHLNQKTTY